MASSKISSIGRTACVSLMPGLREGGSKA
jgi:hypothetical protein